MITLFEEYTDELTPKEQETIVPLLVKILRQTDDASPLTSYKLIDSLGYLRIKTTPARLRAMIHYIRVNKLLVNLIATTKGYFLTKDPEVIEKYKKSLRERVNSINEIIRSFD